MPTSRPEVWLRGPLHGLSSVLQPVAHGLLQCQEEVHEIAGGLSPEQLWRGPGGAASAGYHLRHAAGSLDRLLAYARGEQLSDAQLTRLQEESASGGATLAQLVAEFDATVERALAQLRATPEASLLEPREVGRARLPSTVIGLLFHAAEHTQRHVGQLATTARIVGSRE